jgi:UDPglucose--hexose-1-phosphate uridylyltransferase
MPELRKDPIHGRWVIIATERGVRPKDFTVTRTPLEASFCPFCPGNEGATPPEVLSFRPDGGPANGPGWTLRVIPNKYPALRIEGQVDRRAEGLYDMMNGIGAHEVVIETPQHLTPLDERPLHEVQDILWAWRSRILDLQRDTRFRSVVIFKNHGAIAGASLEHPHSQIIALPIVPKAVEEEMAGALRYFQFRDRCVFCDIIEQELRDGARVVFENEHAVAVAPFASRSPFEVWILPREHGAAFEAGTQAVYRDTAQALQAVTRGLRRALDDPPFNAMLHTAPLGMQGLEHYHWHIEILPKLTSVAGFEWGSGFYINPTPPEKAAEFLRSSEAQR